MNRAKSTFHKRRAGGSSDYFDRPVDGFIQLAVIMSNNSITIQQLGVSFDFPQTISSDDVAAIHNDDSVPASMANSIFDFSR